MGLFGWGNKKQQQESKDPQAEAAGGSRVCFVLCPAVKPQLDRIREEFVAEFGADARISSEKEEAWFLDLPGPGHAFLAYMPAPVPDGEAELNIDGNLFWPNGRDELASSDYGAHLIAGVMGGPDDAVATNHLLTRLARVGLKAFDGLGVYWGDGVITNSRDVFLQMSDDLDPDDLPLFLWVRFQPFRSNDSKVALYTKGLKQFGLMEIEVTPCTWQPSDLLEFIFNVSCYLINQGPVVKDGETVGGDEKQRIKVYHRVGEYDGGNRVYQVRIG